MTTTLTLPHWNYDIATGLAPRQFPTSLRLPLIQHWLAPDKLPKEKATASFAATDEYLCFYVELEDFFPVTQASADNDKLWTLGDTVEFFVKDEAVDDYWEIHVSPNNLIMDIHLPNRDVLQQAEEKWSELVAPSSQTRKMALLDEHGWHVWAWVPWSTLADGGDPAKKVWQINVARYNYSGSKDTAPELSATAHINELSFHRYEEYHRFVLAD